ncbi:putative ribonuclease H-like domain-containing protein [Tanacetum coccineum]
MVSYINKQRRTNHKDYQNCLFAYFLSKKEPQKVIQALSDPSWIEVMQKELLQFKLQKVWTLVDLPYGKRAIGTKWVFRNKKDERRILVRNQARLVAQGYTHEEGINYDEMDMKSVFLYGTIEEEVFVSQPPGFEDPKFPDKVYKVEKALYGLHQAPRAWYETLSTYLLENGFRRGTIDKTFFIKKDKGDILLVQVKQKDDGIFISQNKYVADILKKFDFSTVKTTSTPMDPNKELIKDEEAEDVDVHLYRLMIGSLMYLTTSRPAIMFVVYACARYEIQLLLAGVRGIRNEFVYNPNPYSYNEKQTSSNQPPPAPVRDKLVQLSGNDSHYGFDCPPRVDNHQAFCKLQKVTPFVESKEWIETNNELYTIMEDFMKRINQQREQEVLLAAQREQELLTQKQAAQEKQVPSPNSVFRQLIEECVN